MSSETTIEMEDFGTTQDGRPVSIYTLNRENGIRAKIINYGATLCELHVPDEQGMYMDVVLGFPNLKDYESDANYLGATIGRIAGRISKGLIKIDDEPYQLIRNEGSNHLHGGTPGFDKQVWLAKIIDCGDGQALELEYFSPHGEASYPGNIHVYVTYRLTPDNAIQINFRAVTDAVTPLSLTNHFYFNLNGEGNKSIKNHEVKIVSDLVTEVNDEMIPTGVKKKVMSGINDFRDFSLLKDRIQFLHKSHGDNYFVNDKQDSLQKVASVKVAETDRLMEVYTTASNLQMYTGSELHSSATGKSGISYNNFDGICFECQGYADFSKNLGTEDILITPDQGYKQLTKYKFCGYGKS